MPFLSLLLLAGLILLWRRAERRGKPWSPGWVALGIVFALALPALWALAFDFAAPLAVLALVVWAAGAHCARGRAAARQARAVRKALKRARRAELRGRSGQARWDEGQAATSSDVGASARAVNLLVREHERVLPQDVALKLRELGARLCEADSYLRERGLQESEAGRRLHLIAADYLPDALRAYSRLPRHLAASAPLFEGKTGREVLLEQLEMLLKGVAALLADVAAREGQALLAHGRFLAGKFETARPDFDV